MKWRLLVAVGAVAGGVIWAARRKTQRAEQDAALWAEATDPLKRTDHV
jgi:hypothetical protein